MGRGKIEIEKIEKGSNRNAAYKSRHVGLMKKTFEISVLCNIPAVLITFSPAKKLCIFSQLCRPEDILIKFLKMQDKDETEKEENNENIRIARSKIGPLIEVLKTIKTEDDMAAAQRWINREGSSNNPQGGGSSMPIRSLLIDVHKSAELWFYKLTNLGIVDLLREIKRLPYVDQRILSSLALKFCIKKLLIMINTVSTRKEMVRFSEIHRNAVLEQIHTNNRMLTNVSSGFMQTPKMLQCNAEQQEQEREYRRRHKQQLLLQQQQQLHRHNQQQLFLPNLTSLNYEKHVHETPTHKQQGSASFYQNNNMVIADQNKSVMIQQVQEATTHNQPMTTQRVQESFYNVASLYQKDNEMKILAGGPREPQFQTNHINPPMQTYDHSEMKVFNGRDPQEINQHPPTSSCITVSDDPPLSPSTNFSSFNYSFDSQFPLHDQTPFLDEVGDLPNFYNNLGQSNNQR